MPEMLEARERGVLFDIGHGCGSFAFEVGHALLEQGFLPDTISSDIHMFSIDGPAYDLPTTMSKFLALGMSLMDVIRATTIAPARAIGIQDHFGSLSIGKTADISIMKLEENTLTFEDAFKQTLQANRKLVPITTIKNGRVVWPLISNGDA
jgi:dihydroorotase